MKPVFYNFFKLFCLTEKHIFTSKSECSTWNNVTSHIRNALGSSKKTCFVGFYLKIVVVFHPNWKKNLKNESRWRCWGWFKPFKLENLILTMEHTFFVYRFISPEWMLNEKACVYEDICSLDMPRHAKAKPSKILSILFPRSQTMKI